MKKLTAIILSLCMVVTIFPTSAFASENEPYENIKQRVSSVYGIPQEIVDTLSEEKVRAMDVDEEQVVSVQEEYVNFITYEDGETVAIPSSENEYQNYISSPAMIANPNTLSNSWMRIYIIIIDYGSTMNISSTYTWLIPPRVIFNEYDLLKIYWENGTYIPGSAEGFYSYSTAFSGPTSEDITDFTQNPDNPKEITHAHPMNDSGARQNEFFHMMVSIYKDYGAGAEHAWSMYCHQQRSINWINFLGGTALIGSAFTVSFPLNVLNFGAGVAALSGSAEDYYETHFADAYYTYT